MKGVRLLLLAVTLISATGCRSLRVADLPELPLGRFVTVGGHKLFVRQNGTGPDVVLLHGMGDSSIGWQFVEPALVQAGYRVTVWDALGAGRSDKPKPGDYSLQAHVRRLEGVLDALGVRDAVFVGHSVGGSVALGFAQQNPERVRALCLLDPAAYREGAMGGRWLWKTPLLAEVVLGVLPMRTITRLGLNQNFHNRSAISKKLEGMYLREARRQGAIASLISQERQLIPRDPEKWEQGHSSIRRPTLILWGRADKLVPLAQGMPLSRDIKGSGLVAFPGVGHSPHLEAPQMVLGELLPFLNAAESP